MAIVACCSTSAFAVSIPATANLYQAAGSSAGTAPYGMTVLGGSSITFFATGSIVFNNGTGNNVNDADGIGSASAVDITGFNTLSGFQAPHAGSLVGVFYDPSVGAPATLDFRVIGTNFTTLSPLLNQVFFIGDGLTGDGTGARQTFIAPNLATTLYLGFADAPGYSGVPGAYVDNSGSLDVTIDAPVAGAVPEPASWAMMVVGFGGMGWSMRRKRTVAVRSS